MPAVLSKYKTPDSRPQTVTSTAYQASWPNESNISESNIMSSRLRSSVRNKKDEKSVHSDSRSTERTKVKSSKTKNEYLENKYPGKGDFSNIETCVVDGETLYKCTICRRSFKTERNVLYHCYHNSEKPLKCDVEGCQKSFVTKEHLMYHKRTHTNERPYPCEICDKWFSQKNKAMRHAKIHGAEKPFKCGTCSKRFLASSALKQHQMTHTTRKPFKCSGCEKRFRSKSYLKTHQALTHGPAAQRRFQCTVCKKTFAKTNLRKHMRGHSHLKDRPHKCDTCGLAFTLPKDLKRHLSVHTGKRPFKCPCKGCEQSFPRKDNFERHLKSVHKKQTKDARQIANKIAADIVRSEMLKENTLNNPDLRDSNEEAPQSEINAHTAEQQPDFNRSSENQLMQSTISINHNSNDTHEDVVQPLTSCEEPNDDSQNNDNNPSTPALEKEAVVSGDKVDNDSDDDVVSNASTPRENISAPEQSVDNVTETTYSIKYKDGIETIYVHVSQKDLDTIDEDGHHELYFRSLENKLQNAEIVPIPLNENETLSSYGLHADSTGNTESDFVDANDYRQQFIIAGFALDAHEEVSSSSSHSKSSDDKSVTEN